MGASGTASRVITTSLFPQTFKGVEQTFLFSKIKFDWFAVVRGHLRTAKLSRDGGMPFNA
jgi:hypothetical protein